MKTVTGRVVSSEPIPLSKAATLLSGFASSENDANQAVRAYLRRASAAFTELKSIHREIKSSSIKENKPRSDAKQESNLTSEPVRAKGVDDLVGERGKIHLRKSETVSGEISVNYKQHVEIKEDKKRKEKKKSNKKKEEDDVNEKVKEKVSNEQSNQERKGKKEKKKMKSNGEMGSEERKSKKKRKSKEIDG